MHYLIGHFAEQFLEGDINRIIDLECQTIKGEGHTVMVFDPACVLTSKNIERIYRYIQSTDERTSRRALSLLSVLAMEKRPFSLEKVGESHDELYIAGSIAKQLKAEHIKVLMDKLTHGSPQIQRRVFYILTDMAREECLSTPVVGQIVGLLRSGHKVVKELIVTNLDVISTALKREHIEKIVTSLSDLPPMVQAKALDGLRSLANVLVDSDVRNIKLVLSSRSARVKCACLDLLKACHAVALDDTIDSVIWSLRTTNYSVMVTACRTLGSYATRMSQSQKEKVLQFLKNRTHLLESEGRNVNLNKATVDDVAGILFKIVNAEETKDNNTQLSCDRLVENQKQSKVDFRADIVVSKRKISSIVDDLIGGGDVEAITAYRFIEKNPHILSKKHINRIILAYTAEPKHALLPMTLCLLDVYDLVDHIESLLSILEDDRTRGYASAYYVVSMLATVMEPEHIDRIKALLRVRDTHVREYAFELLRDIHKVRGIS